MTKSKENFLPWKSCLTVLHLTLAVTIFAPAFAQSPLAIDSTASDERTNKLKVEKLEVSSDLVLYNPPNPRHQPLVVIAWDPGRPNHTAPDIERIRSKVFAKHQSISNYFTVNSLGKFLLSETQVLGWYQADKPADHYWGPNDEDDTNGDGWVRGHYEKWTEAILKADAEFDFSVYDKNHDGVVSTNELGVIIAIPQNSPYGTVRPVYSQEHPKALPLVVDGVIIPKIAEWYLGSSINFPVAAHELSHLLLGLPDMYGNPTGHRAKDYSLMDVTYDDSHLDPYHKRKLGWARVTEVNASGLYTLNSAAGSNEVLLLRGPGHSKDEYFLVENRQRTNGFYDSSLPDTGLTVWHIVENYKNTPPPPGVDVEEWNSLGFVGRGIRLLRSVPNNPPIQSLSTFDGSDRRTGYNLRSIDSNPEHAELRWADGTPSGFTISNISSSGPVMSAFIDVPLQAYIAR